MVNFTTKHEPVYRHKNRKEKREREREREESSGAPLLMRKYFELVILFRRAAGTPRCRPDLRADLRSLKNSYRDLPSSN